MATTWAPTTADAIPKIPDEGFPRGLVYPGVTVRAEAGEEVRGPYSVADREIAWMRHTCDTPGEWIRHRRRSVWQRGRSA
jgi:hypothetical protein